MASSVAIVWPELTLGGRRIEISRRIEIVAHDPIRRGHGADLGQGAQGHHRAAVAAGTQFGDVVDLVAIPPVGLYPDLIGAPEQVEVVDVGSAQIDLQGLEDPIQGHVQHLCPHPIHIGEKLRCVGAEGGITQGEIRILPDLTEHRLGAILQLTIAQVGPVLNHHLDTARRAETAHRRRRNGEDPRLFDGSEALLQCSGRRKGRGTFQTLLERI